MQWGRYLGGVARGDMGRSFATRRAVIDELKERVPATIELALAAMAIAIFLGLPAGVLAALAARRRPWGIVDHLLNAGALAGISMPVFWLGLLLQIYVAPVQQRTSFDINVHAVTGLYLVQHAARARRRGLRRCLRHLALPAIALGTIPLAVVSRMTRAAMLETLGQDFVRTARARGLGPVRVAVRHALRNALIPIVTVIGLQGAALLGGAVLTESVFQWPGLGTYIVAAAQKKDLPALQGAVLITATVFVLANLLVDLAYARLDPRIRLGSE